MHDAAAQSSTILLIGPDAGFLNAVAGAAGGVHAASVTVIPEGVEQAAKRAEIDAAAVIVVDIDPRRRESLIALQGITMRCFGRAPVIVARRCVRRRARALAAPDPGFGFPAQAGRAEGRAQGLHQVLEGDLEPARRRQPDHLLPVARRRRRHDDAGDRGGDAPAQGGVEGFELDLPRRSRLPERHLRRLSRPRAAARPRRDRPASGAARPAAPRGHVQPPRLRALRCSPRKAGRPSGRRSTPGSSSGSSTSSRRASRT